MKQVLKSTYQKDRQPTNGPLSIKFQGKKKNKFSSTNCNILKFHLSAALPKKQKH